MIIKDYEGIYFISYLFISRICICKQPFRIIHTHTMNYSCRSFSLLFLDCACSTNNNDSVRHLFSQINSIWNISNRLHSLFAYRTEINLNRTLCKTCVKLSSIVIQVKNFFLRFICVLCGLKQLENSEQIFFEFITATFSSSSLYHWTKIPDCFFSLFLIHNHLLLCLPRTQQNSNSKTKHLRAIIFVVKQKQNKNHWIKIRKYTRILLIYTVFVFVVVPEFCCCCFSKKNKILHLFDFVCVCFCKKIKIKSSIQIK